MAYLLTLGIFLIGLIKKQNKLVFGLTLCLIFLLMGWSHGLADEKNYIGRYYYYNRSDISIITGVLYTFLKGIANTIGFSYEQWLILNALFYVLLMGWISYSFAEKNFVFPLVMMLIYPLCMDATQQRQTLGMCVGWIALYLLFKYQLTIRNCILICALVILASLIHASCIFYIIFIFAKKVNERSVYLVTIVCSIVFLLLGPQNLYAIGSKFFSSEKLLQVLQLTQIRENFTFRLMTAIRIVIIALSYFVPYIYIRKTAKITEFQRYILYANILSLITIGLLPFSIDFYRIQQVLVLFNYCAIARGFRKQKKWMVSIDNLILGLICVFFAIINLYLLVLRHNSSTVFIPFFEQNRILIF